MSVRNAIGSFFGQAASAVSGAANAVTGALTTESSPAYNTLSGSVVASTTTRPKAGTGLVTAPLSSKALSTQSGGRRKKSRRSKRRLSRRSRRKCY
jgi:hypothetical protein